MDFETNTSSFLPGKVGVELFDLGKEWILQLWASDGISVSFEIAKKVVGRNRGFIILATIEDTINKTSKLVRYYAKIQSLHVETVLMHELLKLMSCGPSRYFITILQKELYCWFLNETQERYSHGVITEEVPNLVLASQLRESSVSLVTPELLAELLMMTMIVQLGKFSRIPDNADNWGIVINTGLCDSMPHNYSRLSIIDFSSAEYYGDYFANRTTFSNALFCNMSDLVMRLTLDEKNNTQRMSREEIERFDENTKIPWLVSKQAFFDIVQSACDHTAEWIRNEVQKWITANTPTPPEPVVAAKKKRANKRKRKAMKTKKAEKGKEQEGTSATTSSTTASPVGSVPPAGSPIEGVSTSTAPEEVIATDATTVAAPSTSGTGSIGSITAPTPPPSPQQEAITPQPFPPPLQTYRVPLPSPYESPLERRHLPQHLFEACSDYAEQVRHLDRQIELLCAWFPFHSNTTNK